MLKVFVAVVLAVCLSGCAGTLATQPKYPQMKQNYCEKATGSMQRDCRVVNFETGEFESWNGIR